MVSAPIRIDSYDPSGTPIRIDSQAVRIDGSTSIDAIDAMRTTFRTDDSRLSSLIDSTQTIQIAVALPWSAAVGNLVINISNVTASDIG